MKYSVFKQGSINTLKEPMFFGNPVNVARYDQQKHEIFEKSGVAWTRSKCEIRKGGYS